MADKAKWEGFLSNKLYCKNDIHRIFAVEPYSAVTDKGKSWEADKGNGSKLSLTKVPFFISWACQLWWEKCWRQNVQRINIRRGQSKLWLQESAFRHYQFSCPPVSWACKNWTRILRREFYSQPHPLLWQWRGGLASQISLAWNTKAKTEGNCKGKSFNKKYCSCAISFHLLQEIMNSKKDPS